jgi:sn-glycerol 3-phosphate transport system substrate-binding protein
MLKHAMNRRDFLRTLSLGAGAALLSACAPVAVQQTTGSSAGEQPAAEAEAQTAGSDAPSAEPVTVTLWSSFTGVNGETETELVKRFNESQAEVILDYQFQGSYEETAQKVTAALQAKTAPAMSLLSDVWWFKFYVNQKLLPLDELLAAENVDLSDYQDPLINEGLRQGKHYWIPFARSTPLFYYNKEMWAAAGLEDRGPETWDEFGEWAPQLLQKDGDTIKVSAFVHPDAASYVAWLFQGVTWQFGGKYSDPDFTMHMTDPNTIAAGQFYGDTVHSFSWALPSKDMATDFINGLTASAMMSTGSMGGVRDNAQFEFGTAFLPKKDHFGCCTGGAGLAVLTDATPEQQAAAMKYINFATNTENTAFWAQHTGYMPVRKSAIESEAMQNYFTEFPQFKTAVEQIALTQPQDSARVWVPNGDQIIGAGLERIIVQGDDVETAFADVQATLEKEAEPVVAALKAIEG